jgi:predicted TIM-barrel fold metal-dependent hydrolase
MAISIAERAPDTSLMLDHLLKPDIKQHTLDPWFGEDRVVFGGDWPPLLTANSTYARSFYRLASA